MGRTGRRGGERVIKLDVRIPSTLAQGGTGWHREASWIPMEEETEFAVIEMDNWKLMECESRVCPGTVRVKSGL